MSIAVPGWSRHRLKFSTEINKSSLPDGTDADFEFDYVDISRVSQGVIDPEPQLTVFSKAPSRARRLAQPGDTIVSTVRTYLRAVAEVSVSEMPQVFSTGFAVLNARPGIIHPRFLTYYLQSTPFVERVVADSVGVSYPAINASDIAAYDFWAPPIDHQRAIADFLDRETAQIDAMIEAQTTLVSLLDERLRSATNRAVFGLDSGSSDDENGKSVRYVPSGMAHLATGLALEGIPNHWSVYRFKKCFHRVERRNGNESAQLMSLTSGGLVVPRAETGDRQQPAPESIPRYLLVEPCDLVVNPMWLIGGALGVSTSSGAVSPDYRVFTVDTDILVPRYVHHVLRSTPYRHQYALFARANTTFDRRIQQIDLGNLAIPVPPRAEQRRIVRDIDGTVGQSRNLIQSAITTIGLLRERREALITAAVTGRIDPRTDLERIDPTTEQEAS